MSNTIKKQKCLRCDYEWWPKTLQPPVVCAKCRSKYWNRPYVRNVKKKARKENLDE